MARSRFTIVAALLLCALQACAGAKKAPKVKVPLNPLELDPASFDSAVRGYESLVQSKPYAPFLQNTRDWECIYHVAFLLPQACGTGDEIPDREACCAAVRALTDADKGNCFCQDRITSDSATLSALLNLIQATTCPINFPIPKVEPEQLQFAFPETPPCIGARRTRGTLENLSFLGISKLPEPLDDLPTFADLFKPAESGPYPTSFTYVNVTRPKPSIIINEFSSATEFQALVAYPADREAEVLDPATGVALKPVVGKTRGPKKLPIVAFSPGFGSPPEAFLRWITHMASFGMIVIAQKSTEAVVIDVDRATPEAWIDDIAYSLRYLRNAGKTKESFLYKRVDARRAGITGHSFGSTLAMAVPPLAAKYKVTVRAIAAVEPTCVPFADVCDFPMEALAKRSSGIKYLIMGGNEDNTALPSHAEYFKELVKKSGELLIFDGNHCLGEVDPILWPFLPDCGRGSVSPFDQIKFVHETVGDFFTKMLFAI